ncbi:threonine aldolase family protein [Ruminiclostridium cellulolyticum]|uniref:Aromatic amino acid beta-eliminating lyase/threonine aldolase n=1 Tax=Ruminiclostridium cellulolyticum (strain ATCC 35319 / DSM 5812 / JCM 6584 / H10) TaxID=394503 RepID=B8I792_RUMCH|nr:low specificity L-threonine aldolase [Ruminiclostridium cellulolyticum]ACL75016.1 aromatic amino acid beta-eliminating lyase/threonine aldolase [Ruminiclostridium cellulolyticum H10]
MIRFNCDYSEGAHPKVLEKLLQTNMEQTAGYGMDPYCNKAAGMIKDKCLRQDMEVHFLVGGTQTNLTVISAALRPHQGAIAANTGHICTHETGAIEATGHKVIELSSRDGKLTAEQVAETVKSHYSDESREHTVQPKMVYISNPTEIGTIYSKKELFELSRICRENSLFLYMDGARLGYGLCAEDNDLDLPTIAQLCDAFYIGGTKIGALFGEALVVCNEELKKDLRYIIKQKGGMLAKGRLLGLQFISLMENDLYFEIATHANKMALLIKEALLKKGYSFLISSTTNQQFPILPNDILVRLKSKFEYSFWQEIDENTSAVRFCTSWATSPEDVRKLVEEIENG